MDVNAANNEELRAMDCAIHFGNVKAVHALAEAGAELTAEFPGRKPLLYYARNNQEMTTVLVKLGVDVNSRGGWPYTPLASAARHG